jgi:tRNA 2-selenouridine synthase
MPNPELIDDLSPASLAAFDTVIDVRSPTEFARDHLPGALNLPVLDDDERARVGTIYVQESAFLARRLGGALVAKNIGRHIEVALADKPQGWRPLVYCWRGGQRSRAMAMVLGQVGWRAGLVLDGYKRWRREVAAGLLQEGPPHRVLLLDGETGSGKTEVLRRLIARGAQAIDLEGLAGHRGSAFGAPPGVQQPSQTLFESRLWDVLRRLDPSRPILVEAESNRIGRIRIPRRLWAGMQAAPRIELSAPAAARARHVATAYADLAGSAAALTSAIDKLRPMHARAVIERWFALAEAGAHVELALDLIERHYDPAYARARGRGACGALQTRIEMSATDDAELDRVVGLLIDGQGLMR